MDASFLPQAFAGPTTSKTGFKIVPGVAVRLEVGPSSGEKGGFLCLSFEHPYPKLPKELGFAALLAGK